MEIHAVAVLGAGTMGSGIAQVCAQVGCRVALFDVRLELAEQGLARVGKFLQKGVDKDKVTPEEKAAALERIRPSAEVAEAVAGCQLVVEAAPEDLALKRRIFDELSGVAADDAVLATNTSSLPISRIAAGNPAVARIVGMHFFNPVPLMKLLEIVVGEQTAKTTVATARAFGERLGKEVITVRDAPGFASSRLGIALAMEATATPWGRCG
ncbi:MAG: 3-hydroxyacyl-CoA dehydrogenase family protein [Planctomycetota bacterium]|jgi:3-hydroxybutyryl-CoA dehydrogenase